MAVAFAVTVQAETPADHSQPKEQASPKLTVLPTMKGYMGRLGTLMNFLFREVDEPSKRDEVQQVINEMKSHLSEVKDKLLPRQILAMAGGQARLTAIGGFKACVDGAIDTLDAISSNIIDENFQAARKSLLYLDQLRRDCHTEYAGE
ncbi:MAG: hypothetical protein RIC14_10625 [Filomicrobium sp.]